MEVTINEVDQNIENLEVVSISQISAIDGKTVEEVEYVEYTVIGKNSKWIQWTLLDKFRNENPGVI